jgi:hypothetical protein
MDAELFASLLPVLLDPTCPTALQADCSVVEEHPPRDKIIEHSRGGDSPEVSALSSKSSQPKVSLCYGLLV